MWLTKDDVIRGGGGWPWSPCPPLSHRYKPKKSFNPHWMEGGWGKFEVKWGEVLRLRMWSAKNMPICEHGGQTFDHTLISNSLPSTSLTGWWAGQAGQLSNISKQQDMLIYSNIIIKIIIQQDMLIYSKETHTYCSLHFSLIIFGIGSKYFPL